MAGHRVLVIGGGGREHALCLGLNKSPHVSQIFCSPGNAGTAIFAKNVDLSVGGNSSIVDFCQQESVNLVVVGPEAPLCDGLADILINQGIPCFGPVASLANLEGSKLHAKQIMRHVGVPTADFKILDETSDIDAELDDYSNNPWVIKRDVLAGGKGVVVTKDFQEARQFVKDSITSDGKVLLEEFLPGEEASMLVVMDGSGYVCLPASQDHKRVFDGDNGPNTGGMGAYCPAPVVTDLVHEKVVSRIVGPMFEYLSNCEIPYRGVLYVGLMITEDGDPNVVEFNVRFGDPECQITLPLIKTDLFDLLIGAATDSLKDLEVQFHNAFALTVVLASEGYPASPIKGRNINGLNTQLPTMEIGSNWINFAGVKKSGDSYLASGGRVLSCSAISDSLAGAAELAYDLVESISLEGSHYRTDIGGKAL